jgi:protein-disulfide isomerase
VRRRFLLGLLSVLMLSVPASAIAAAKAAPRGDWTHVVAATPAGGFALGNPKARVKLVEYGSLSCPHCRAFDQEGVPTLLAKYVKSGQVSWEFRNYVRDPVDLTAALIARCNGARSFFPLARAIFKDQPVWFGKAIAAPKDQLQKIADMPPQQQFVAMAKLVGLDAWAVAHGLPAAKTNQCLANVKSIDQLVQMTGDATKQHPDFRGTPSFLINGGLVKDVGTWDALEPKLKAALGG